MSFKNVYNALFNQISSSSTLLVYIDPTQFLKGFKQNIPNQEYTVIFEPGNEEEENATQIYNEMKEVIYHIDIYMRTILTAVDGVKGSIIGYGSKKGVLEFVDDIKAAIRADLTLGYSRKGSSISAENAGTSFILSAIKKYISVSINGRIPTGYDSINCGDSSLTGDQIASNIQTALRALGNHDDDGYNDALCTFNNDTKKFTITSNSYSPKSNVVVSAGGSNDCSALVGFDNPNEVSGRNITKIGFGTVTTDNRVFPVRYRILPVKIVEEIII